VPRTPLLKIKRDHKVKPKKKVSLRFCKILEMYRINNQKISDFFSFVNNKVWQNNFQTIVIRRKKNRYFGNLNVIALVINILLCLYFFIQKLLKRRILFW